MGSVTVGIDIGTTSVKAVAADDAGNVLTRCRLPHRLIATRPDQFEHDPQEAWVDGVTAAWRQVSAGHDVAGVTVAAMVPSLCGVDAGGTPVSAGLLYGDARGGAVVTGVTGVDGEAAGFARWLVANTDAPGFWPAQAVANHALCGVGAIDTTTAMAMLPLFDWVGWDAEVCAGLGFEPERLPRLSPGAAAIGDIAGVPISGGTVDVLAEQLVADARAAGDVLVLCGTTLIVWALTDGWPEAEGLWTVPSTAPGLSAIGGASNAGGLFLDTVRRLVGPVDEADFAAVDPDRIPVWLPYLRGERTPLNDPHRRAELVDLELGHGAPEVLQAAYEASAFVVRHHLELAPVEAKRIVAVGGGTRSAPWMQALADASGLPVDVSAVPDGAALGAAFIARVTAGLEPDTSGGGRWARLERRVEPRPAWVNGGERRYQTFIERTRR